MAPSSSIVIIGIGNDFRTDDGAGPEAARRVATFHFPGVSVIDGVGDGTDLINAWEGKELAIVIDCVHSDNQPGRVYRFDGLNEDMH